MATRTQKSLDIEDALLDRYITTFTYDNEKREVELYYQGILQDRDNSEESEVEAVRAWELGDDSWKLFKIKKIKNLKVDKKRTHEGERNGYNPEDSAFVKRYARVGRVKISRV